MEQGVSEPCVADPNVLGGALKSFRNFDLLIDRAQQRRRTGKQYRVRLLSSPAGGARSCTIFSEKDLEFSSHEEAFRDLALKIPERRRNPEEIGARLFRALFSPEIGRRWESSLSQVHQEGQGLRLRLRLGEVPELEEWPWELLYDHGHEKFLSLARDLSVVRYLNNAVPARIQKLQPPIRILVVVANPEGCGPIEGDHEWKLLSQHLANLIAERKVVLERLPAPTLVELEKALKKPWHVLHFVGHGQFESGEGWLILEDAEGQRNEVTGRKLKILLESQKELQLAVLNSCAGARTSREDLFSGVAQSLVRAGVPTVIAMRERISDRAALAFAERFYEALSEGLLVEASLGEARRGMQAGLNDLEWSTPVLYMRGDVPIVLDGGTSSQSRRSSWRSRRNLIAAALGLASLGGAYWLSTLPDRSSDPGCPSPAGLSMSFVKIEPGRFTMGSKVQRSVEITRPYCLGRFEVTQRQWRRVMGTLPPQEKDGADLPVGNVSWNDAKAFAVRLDQKEPRAHYRLPTESQWEYAARAETSGRYSFGGDSADLEQYGNCGKAGEPTPGGSFRKNPWGLYDMYGNMSEWVEDWDGPLLEALAVDPEGPATGIEKVRRGGSFEYKIRCDSNFRTHSSPDRHDKSFGFRIVRDPVKL